MSFLFEDRTQLGALMNRHDWSRTPLGSPDTWPLSLRTIVGTVLASRYPFWIGWGPDLLLLYNDPYAQILGTKHPSALGRPASEVWREIWHVVGPRIDRVVSTGRATFDEALLLVMERHGYAEETYFTFSYSPLFDDGGGIAGNFCVVVEDTERVIGARRLALLRDLATSLASATSERDVFNAVERSLAGEPRDIPFSLLYTFDSSTSQARLRAWSGFEDGGVEDTIDLTSPSASWLLNEVASGRMAAPIAFAPGDRQLPHGAWETAPRQVLVLPLAQQGQTAPAGALVAGLNPCRPFDEGYQSFLGLVAGQVASGLANARAHEEERRRAEALAAVDRAKTAFFSNVSHEFRTPLTLMLGPTEDALAGEGVMHREQLETVYRNELRLLKLVNSLLDFSRIEAGRARATYEPTNLAALTADLASTFRSAIERGGLARSAVSAARFVGS